MSRVVQCAINAELVSLVLCSVIPMQNWCLVQGAINVELVSCVVQCDIIAELVCLVLCSLILVKNSQCSQGSLKNANV